MSVELSSAQPVTKPVAAIVSQSGKAKVKSTVEADASAGSSFSAVLTSLDAPTEQSGVADATLIPEDMTQPVSDPLTPQASNFPTDLALLLAQAGKVAGTQLSSASDELPVGAKGVIHLASKANGNDKPDVLTVKSALLGTEKSGDFVHKVESESGQMGLALSSQAHKSKDGDLRFGGAASFAESREIKQSSLMEISAKESTFSSTLAASGMGDSFVRSSEKTVGKSSALSSGYGGDGPWGLNASLAGSHTDAPSVIAGPSMSSPETAVADTVNYWVTQGVQNAQLKLDGFGGAPVEVSISLKGDEAHVDFRTDQPEIRQVLEGAVAHLKELLSSEGLVLSGVSVGASGQDGAGGAQEQRSRSDTRQATIVTAQAPPTAIGQRVGSSVGRALDLFV